MSLIQVVQEEISDNLDRRRFEITNLRRVLLSYVGKPLESTVVRMAIPLLYANWEGYVKEVCQLYLEYIERSGTKNCELKADLLGYLWSSSLRPLTGGLNFEKKKAIAELALHRMDDCVKFSENERNIHTKANLKFEVLQDIADHLCFNISLLNTYKRHLNSLVKLRNNIAHGSFPSSMDYDIFNEHAESVIGLMEGFENIVIYNLDIRNFCS
jgi:hypothetical protein